MQFNLLYNTESEVNQVQWERRIWGENKICVHIMLWERENLLFSFFTTRGLVRADGMTIFELPRLTNLMDEFEAGKISTLRGLLGMMRVARSKGSFWGIGGASGHGMGRVKEPLLAIKCLWEEFLSPSILIAYSTVSLPMTILMVMCGPIIHTALLSEFPVKMVGHIGVLDFLLANVGNLDLLRLLPVLKTAFLEHLRELYPTHGLDQLDIICPHFDKIHGLPIPLCLWHFLHILW